MNADFFFFFEFLNVSALCGMFITLASVISELKVPNREVDKRTNKCAKKWPHHKASYTRRMARANIIPPFRFLSQT